ncbi:MAG: hypothetical protein JW800_02075 [Candidatus Omnitrophica bacterium]|nr:hypothetical protein [Candidatus Omnitrophota bacterium]
MPIDNPRLRKYIFYSVLLIASVIIAILMGELFLAKISPQPLYTFEKGIFINVEDCGYTLAPNITSLQVQPEYRYHIKTNSYGFRGREPQFNADFRVLVLGDSFGMGQGVEGEETFSSVSQSYFDSQQSGVDIFNASVSGYSIVNELGVLTRWIGEYKPNVVALFVNEYDLGERKSIVVQEGYLVEEAGEELPFKFRTWLNRHSRIYCLVKRVYYTKNKSWMTAGEHEKLEEEDILYTAQEIGKMNQICRDRGTSFIVIFSPSMWLHPAMKLLEQKLRNDLVYVLDWASLIPKDRTGELFYVLDGHLNAKGNRYVSDYFTALVQAEMAKIHATR